MTSTGQGDKLKSTGLEDKLEVNRPRRSIEINAYQTVETVQKNQTAFLGFMLSATVCQQYNNRSEKLVKQRENSKTLCKKATLKKTENWVLRSIIS